MVGFQSTLPRRERRDSYYKGKKYSKFQSTLPRRERQFYYRKNDVAFEISIHAPAKGATFGTRDKKRKNLLFQSTLPRRERPLENHEERIAKLISIHAPAKGATILSMPHHLISLNFNPRSREGSDTETERVKRQYSNFNPRSREGSDFEYYSIKTNSFISIHAPAKGAT